jgi:peptide chain release factor 3
VRDETSPTATAGTASAATTAGNAMSPLAREIARRRTFAIIAHPDAGKTTLTEKLLLLGGAIQLAGEIKAKGDRRRTRSDWMDIERQRGISVVTSVMTFEYQGHVVNLLDTPGHEDFSEDTYRTLTAVDAAVMVLDAAKGIESRTRKLLEICRLRDIPIITFINKMDREARDPLELLDEIEKTLAMDTAPVVWPIGQGRGFKGTFDLATSRYRALDAAGGSAGSTISGKAGTGDLELSGVDDVRLDDLLEPEALAAWRDEVALVRDASKPFELKPFLEGHQTPVLFGSALRNFGVRDLLDTLIAHAPPPRAQKADRRIVDAAEAKMTGLVFKIQANMDPNHRDRIAFMRLCSGKLTKGMKAKLVRTGKIVGLHAPQFFFAQDRSIATEAFAGDVVGIPNHGLLRIGDTLTEGEDLSFTGVPNFAPELLRRVRVGDAMKGKKLREALQELAEEGVVQLFAPVDGSNLVIGVVGALQLDVLADRLRAEYGLDTTLETAGLELARWINADDPAVLNGFVEKNRFNIARDVDGDPVFLARSSFDLKWSLDHNPGIRFTDIKETQNRSTS